MNIKTVSIPLDKDLKTEGVICTMIDGYVVGLKNEGYKISINTIVKTVSNPNIPFVQTITMCKEEQNGKVVGDSNAGSGNGGSAVPQA